MIIMDLTVVRVGAGEPDGRWAGRPHHHKEQVLRGWPSRRAEAEETYTDTYGAQVLIWLREDVLVKSIALLTGGSRDESGLPGGADARWAAGAAAAAAATPRHRRAALRTDTGASLRVTGDLPTLTLINGTSGADMHVRGRGPQAYCYV